MKESRKTELMDKLFVLLVDTIKIAHPQLTDKEAENAVINIVNYKQLEAMREGK